MVSFCNHPVFTVRVGVQSAASVAIPKELLPGTLNLLWALVLLYIWVLNLFIHSSVTKLKVQAKKSKNFYLKIKQIKGYFAAVVCQADVKARAK